MSPRPQSIAERNRRQRMLDLVQGRLCTAVNQLASIARGQHLPHTIPAPADVWRSFKEQKQ